MTRPSRLSVLRSALVAASGIAAITAAQAQIVPDAETQMVATWNLLSGNIGANLPTFQAQLGEFLKQHNEMAARLKWYEGDDRGLRALLAVPAPKGKTK